MSVVKVVIIGDHFVGKTSIAITYTSNDFPDIYCPTLLDPHYMTYDININSKSTKDKEKKTVSITIWDTAGQDDSSSLSVPNYYMDASVFLLCFNVISRNSFQSIKSRWIPEIRRFSPNVPVILIGTKSDLIKADHSVESLKKILRNELNKLDTQNWINEQKILLIYGYLKDFIQRISIHSIEYIMDVIAPILISFIEIRLICGRLYVTNLEAQQICDELGIMEYQLTSALNNFNVYNTFDIGIKIGLWYNECIKNGINHCNPTNTIQNRRNWFKKFCKNKYTIQKTYKACALM